MRKLLYDIIFFSILLSTGSAQSNYALSFSPGTNKAVMVPYVGTLAPTGSLTVEAWMNADTLGGSPSIISKTESGGYAFYATSGILRFDIRLNGQYRTVSASGAGLLHSWHHIAATSDGRYVSLYVDGVLKETFDTGNYYPIQYAYNNALIIGAEASNANNTGGSYFSGALDEVRIWNTVRSNGEINSGMNTTLTGNESGLIGYWNFDEGTGTTANDLTANGNDGTLLNSPAWISSGVTLPVELISFSARQQSSTIELKWKTATEVNNYGFEIQRSDIRDQRSENNGHSNAERPARRFFGRRLDSSSRSEESSAWTKVGFIEGNGTTSTAHEYSFFDRSLTAGIYSYRLKQIDRDGKFEYSKEVEVTIDAAPAKFELAQNYPNPFNPTTTISFSVPVSGRISVKVFDGIGREVAVIADGYFSPGDYSRRFDASSLASGIYFYQLQSNAYSVTKVMSLLK